MKKLVVLVKQWLCLNTFTVFSSSHGKQQIPNKLLVDTWKAQE